MENPDRKHTDKVTIIIPCREINYFTERCIRFCERLPEQKEIIVVPDSLCPGYPAVKRNWAMERATGNVYAFIDSDAYPAYDWLEKALYYLRYHSAVCGPGILPHDASPSEIVADLVLQMMPYSYRVVPRGENIISEFPTFNLVVRKEAATPFENYLTGEDTLFCRKIKEGIFYHPSIVVYHNRRPLWKPLWKQVGTFGRHRGNFIKLALVGLVTVMFTYFINFIKGIFMRRPS